MKWTLPADQKASRGLVILTVVGCIGASVVVINQTPKLDLLCAGVVALLSIAVGVLRQVRVTGRVDPMSPTVFPLVYVSFSTLFPGWLILVSGQALMGFQPDLFGSRTASLLALSAIGFAVGVHFTWRVSPRPPRNSAWDSDLRVLRQVRLIGRAMVLGLIAFAAVNVLSRGVQGRAAAQSSYQLMDSARAAALIASVPAVVILLVCRNKLPPQRLPVDLALIACLVVVSAANGGRATAIEVLITVTFFLTRRRNSAKRAVIAVVAVLAFSVIVLFYRQHQMDATQHGVVTSIATDLSPVTYTVGLVDAHVPSDPPYQHGLTFLSAAIRQFPSVLTQPLLGSPEHTGSQLFRNQILHLTDANSGYGFSLPAEGVLNFGMAGALVVPFLIGVLLARAYPRADTSSLRAPACLYVIIVATLPFAYRSDALGAIKGVLYPTLFFLLLSSVMGWLSRRPGRTANRLSGVTIPRRHQPGPPRQ